MRKALVAALACAFALCLVLAGCSGGGSGSSSAADAKAAWVGTWDLVEMDDNGEVTSADDINKLKELGLDVYLALDEDGTAVLVLFGESVDGTWEAESASAAVITLKEQPVDLTLEDGALKMVQDGSTLSFVKGDQRSSSAAASSSPAASS